MSAPARTLLQAAPTTQALPGGAPPHELMEAFQRFSSASQRLEQKYEALRQETEELKLRLRQKDEEIKRNARLAILGETAAALAHEVRNPIGALKIFLSLLKSDVADRPQASEMVSHMDRTISSLNHVVENILHFAKDGSGALAPVNLHALLREQGAVISSDPRGTLEVTFDLTGNQFILGNEHSLRHVFSNILLNAAQSVKWAGIVKVTVSDNGPGVSPELLPKLFEPFVTGKNEGTGLGLSVARKMLSQQGASITLKNRAAPAHGALVTIQFERNGISAQEARCKQSCSKETVS
jgi:two-component system sensor histidine kinase HydH